VLIFLNVALGCCSIVRVSLRVLFQYLKRAVNQRRPAQFPQYTVSSDRFPWPDYLDPPSTNSPDPRSEVKYPRPGIPSHVCPNSSSQIHLARAKDRQSMIPIQKCPKPPRSQANDPKPNLPIAKGPKLNVPSWGAPKSKLPSQRSQVKHAAIPN